jgi:hypothetical protein
MEPLQRERERERERRFIHRAPFIHLSKSPVDEPSSRFPKRGNYGDARLQSLFYTSFRVPSKGALPPGSFHRTPTERDIHPYSLFQPHLKVTGR